MLNGKAMFKINMLLMRFEFLGKTDSLISFSSSISFGRSNIRSTYEDGPVSERVFPLAFFRGSKSLHKWSRLRRILFGWHRPTSGSAFSLPSLQSLTPHKRIKTVPCPNQFIFFFGDLVFASQFKVKVSTKSNFRLAYKDSSLSQTVFPFL